MPVAVGVGITHVVGADQSAVATQSGLTDQNHIGLSDQNGNNLTDQNGD